ncbi:hypothetical protein EIP91_001525 [Steccherinum ochraceum]|uniref:Uncharacterized protein n=1 Tax=Steccherinum ochraceum TaxID=92696 RepID=A0A4R0RVR9_9APHY|nr:hypothetical protein EIP91_001525 [Steccherinum ochraceum]
MTESRSRSSSSSTAAHSPTPAFSDDDDASPKPETIRLTIPTRYYTLPAAAVFAGTTIGLVRGSREASLRFLAENAHRPPTTVKGWYFYNKTKNYRVILGALKHASTDAFKLGVTATGWVALEEGCNRAGLDDFAEVTAGVGTAEWKGGGSRLRWSGEGGVSRRSAADRDISRRPSPALPLPHHPPRPPRPLDTVCSVSDSPLPALAPLRAFFRACLIDSMLKLQFWPTTPGDLTPKAGPNGQERTNPFDSHLSPALPPITTSSLSSAATAASPAPRSPSAHQPAPSTPTAAAPSYHHQLLSTPHHLLSPSISASTPTGLADPFDAHPPIPHHPIPAPLTPTASLVVAQPTTSLSIHAPVFNMQQPPPPKRLAGSGSTTTTSTSTESASGSTAKSRSSVSATRTPNTPNGSSQATTTTPNTTHAPNSAAPTMTSSISNGTGGPSRGQIHVKLISARGLNVRSSRARPYAVVQFEQNEFVSRDPTDESDKEVKGVATNLSRNSSSTALSALGKVAPGTALNGHSNGHSTPNGNRARSANHSPSSSAGSGKAGLSVMFGAARISAHNPVWKHEVSFDVTSEQSAITFNIYDRAVSDLGFLGTLQIKPTKRALTPRDFEFLKLIGRGTFGRVFQVRKKDTKRIYAMKVLSKREIIAKKEVAHTIGERKILQRSLDSPFLVGLKFSFQTDTDLYLVTDFKSGGELFWHLQKETRFTEERARFYIAELVLALEHLHKYDIVYRDLKPENILLDATGHVALCDFGLSKPDLRSDELTNTFCGTTEYLAPEVLLDEHGYSKLVDFWSLGVLLFEMCCGWSPFYAEDTQQMYKNICFGKIRFPKGVINEDGKQFVKGLLNRNPKHRLGSQRDAAELKEHAFFKVIDWAALSRKQVTPPFKPVVESDESVANFDPEFTTADVREQALSDWDDDDPSEDWVALSQSQPNNAVHTPNGPLGSDKPPNAAAAAATALALSSGVGSAAATNASNGIQMPQKKKKHREVAGTPLTNSVQENFRGFTFHGESIVPESAAGLLAQQVRDEEAAVQDEEGAALRSAEEELLDLESPVGRYAQQRRGISLDGFDDELNV